MSRYEEQEVDKVVANTSGGGAKKMKFEADFKYRIGFPRFRTTADGDKVSIIKVGFFPFNEDLKKSFLVTEDDDLNKRCIPIMGQPKYRFVTPIIVYKTDKNGVAVTPPSWEVVPYVFSDDTMKQLQDINAEWDLTKVDVFVRIKEKTDIKFQNVTITPTKEALWAKGPKTAEEVKAKAAEIAEIQHTAVALDASPDQVRKWLGFEPAGEETSDSAYDEAGTSGEAGHDTPDASAGGDEEGEIDKWV